MTINIGNYESIRIDSSVTAIPEEETIEEVYNKAFSIIKNELNPRIKAIQEKYKK